MGEIRVLLVDVDSQKGFPNLALMKISAYHKAQGHYVDLVKGVPDSIPVQEYQMAYISCIYYQNADAATDYNLALNDIGVYSRLGGSGVSNEICLPEDIEHLKPDYSLYDVDFSMGFTSRGCIRKCPWCIVPKKEGKIRDHAEIAEFLHPDHDKVVLLDNNFQASPRWEENLEFLIKNDLSVNFNQGLDFRILTPDFAEYLGHTRFRTWRFNKRRVSFAYDTPSMEAHVKRGIEILQDNGVAPSAVMVYILVGFNTDIEEDMARVKVVEELGADPYIMRYNGNEGPHGILKHYARFINWRINRSKSVEAFHDYDYSDSKEAIKAVFGVHPSPDWGGYGCPQGGYTWANRDIDKETEEIEDIQEELEVD